MRTASRAGGHDFPLRHGGLILKSSLVLFNVGGVSTATVMKCQASVLLRAKVPLRMPTMIMGTSAAMASLTTGRILMHASCPMTL